MTVNKVTVHIHGANGVGGRFPFVVACLDNDLTKELYKTKAVDGTNPMWDDKFELDLALETKNLEADGKPAPRYLTLFIFDTGVQGVPSLGSAGVLLDTVRNKRVAKGDFPIVNGSGTLNVTVEEHKGWSNTAKIAGVAGAIGVAGLAAGLTTLTVKNRKKKKKPEEDPANAEERDHDPDNDEYDEDDEDDDDEDPPQGYPPHSDHA